MKPLALFDELEKGILQLFKAADLYNLHLIALARNEEPNKELINRILTTNTISIFAIIEGFYSDNERKAFEQNEYLKAISDQIMLSTYTALECYLIAKFHEYARWKKLDKDPRIINAIRFMRRSLDEVKDCYKDILDIYLAQFELSGSWMSHDPAFKPSDTWKRIKDVEKVRHEVAHLGKSQIYSSRLLSDPWGPFDFVRRWVSAFDANFDALILDERPTPMIEEYQERVARVCGHD